MAVVAPDGFGVKQKSGGVWGGVCCSSHISCSPGTSNQCLARKVAFSRGGIAVTWGCPSGFLSPSAQWEPRASDAGGCFILGNALWVFLTHLAAAPPSPRAGLFLCFLTFPSSAPGGTSDALAKQHLGSPNMKWGWDPFCHSRHGPDSRGLQV